MSEMSVSSRWKSRKNVNKLSAPFKVKLILIFGWKKRLNRCRVNFLSLFATVAIFYIQFHISIPFSEVLACRLTRVSVCRELLGFLNV